MFAPAASGSSMLGIGTSAAATDARKWLVEAVSLDATRLFSLKRGRGGDGGRNSSSTAEGSGVLGFVSGSWKRKPFGRVAAPEC